METEGVTRVEASVAWVGDKPTQLVEGAFKDGSIKPAQVVVDIGCGFGRNANWLESKGVKVTGINIISSELKVSQEKAKENGLDTSFMVGSATKLPLADSSCDAAIDSGCSHMLSAEDQITAESEQARVVKPGGHLLYFGFSKDHPASISNPSSPMYRSLEDIKRIYGNDFEIVTSNVVEWKPSPEEHANFDMHKGINVVMRRKINVSSQP